MLRKANSFPTRTENVPAHYYVPDYEFIECEPIPRLDRGIVWAHSLGASPHCDFDEIFCALEHKLDQVKINKDEAARLRQEYRMRLKEERCRKAAYIKVHQYQEEDQDGQS
jgi:hypothetical protein